MIFSTLDDLRAACRDLPAGDQAAAAAALARQAVLTNPIEVTAQMVANYAAGGAAINRLAETAGAALTVVPLDLDRP
ncbi:nicotinate-nucleotide--dimethylbenzimidazole phosphoribosyltransferase, partial [Rhodoplanes sp. SY1]|uniref:nicotinate-nucleotide--dimethylbenzimidazole phosphoribosyltransferase n=1 Tax=Rhodoplanes sp. SY1 TaxID=3166646 RepID=UPI0038B62EF7